MIYKQQHFLSSLSTENLYSPDEVHPVANNENKTNIKLTNLTKNDTVIHTARCDNKQYTNCGLPELN